MSLTREDIAFEVLAADGCPPTPWHDIDICEVWFLPGVCVQCWRDFAAGAAFKRNMAVAVKAAVGLRLWQQQRKERREHVRIRVGSAS